MSIIRSMLRFQAASLLIKYKSPVRPAFPVTCNRCYSNNKKEQDDEITNEPIKYSTTVASKWMARDTTKGTKNTRPEYEPMVIIISLAVFMLYFCLLREENEIDVNLGKSLYSSIDGLEEVQLRMSLKYNQDHGLDTQDIEKRLKEIETEKHG